MSATARDHAQPDALPHFSMLVRLLAFIPLLASLACTEPEAPRLKDELVLQGDVFLDPQTLECEVFLGGRPGMHVIHAQGLACRVLVNTAGLLHVVVVGG